MARLYLVRHAEPAGTWGEHPDPGLSPLGQRQAKAILDQLLATGARAAISSPLRRCQETATPFLSAAGLVARIEPRVAEVTAPKGQQNPRDWLRSVLEGKWHADPALDAWRGEVGAALVACTEDTVVFSHFVAINAAVSLATGAEAVTVFKPGHASITVLETDGMGLRLLALGPEAAVVLT